MNNPIIYNIPVTMVDAYRGRHIIVRSSNPRQLTESLYGEDPASISYIQILGLDAETADLMHWGNGIPIDLVVQDLANELPLLYRYSPLLATHPIRVSLPVLPGFSKMVKLAVSLDFAVKLEGSQPESALQEELLHTASSYLHQSTVSQPIEYFHSIFLAFYRGESVTLWDIQEENPSRVRYVTDRGEETISRRFSGVELKGSLDSFVPELKAELAVQEGECRHCAFFENCSGYFKWPAGDYSCGGVKSIFRTLRDAAEELRRDMGAYQNQKGNERS